MQKNLKSTINSLNFKKTVFIFFHAKFTLNNEWRSSILLYQHHWNFNRHNVIMDGNNFEFPNLLTSFILTHFTKSNDANTVVRTSAAYDFGRVNFCNLFVLDVLSHKVLFKYTWSSYRDRLTSANIQFYKIFKKNFSVVSILIIHLCATKFQQIQKNKYSMAS